MSNVFIEAFSKSSFFFFIFFILLLAGDGSTQPANIFLTLDGTIKVGDLGLSRELSEHTLQAHSKVGTPLYMSPEVLRGDGYGFGSDVWSLGCLLYELAMLKVRYIFGLCLSLSLYLSRPN